MALAVVASGAWAASQFWGPPSRVSTGVSPTAVEKTPGGSAAHSHEEDSEPVNVNDPLGGHAHFITVQSGTNRLLLGAHSGLLESYDDGKSWSRIDVRGELQSTDFMNFVIDPANPNVMYAGGHDLGVVKSTDGGRTWAKANTGLAGTDVHALTYDIHFQRLFAFSVGYGIFESKDGGASWQRKDDGPRNPNVQSFAFLDVPTDMEQSMGKEYRGYLFAGTEGGIYRANPCFCGWTAMGEARFQYSTVYTLVVNPSDDTIYAGTKDGLFKSADAGQTWTQVLSRQKIMGIAVNPDNPRILYSVSEDGGVFRSQDGGASWKATEPSYIK
jgi:ligand-binding sensor domain-containing protein